MEPWTRSSSERSLRRVVQLNKMESSADLMGVVVPGASSVYTMTRSLITIDQAIANLKESLEAAYAAEDRLKEVLKQNGLLS